MIQLSLTTSNAKQTSTVTETTTSDTTTTVNCAFDPCLIPNFCGDGRRCELDKFCRHICICLEGSTHANCKPTTIQPSLTTSNVKQTSTVTETTTSDTTTTVNCPFDPCLIPNFCGDGRRCELDKFCRHICICLEDSTHANCKPTMIQLSLTTSNAKQTNTVTETTTSDTTTTVNCAFDPCLIPNFCGDGRRCELDKFCRHICICLEGSTHANCKPTTIQPSLTTSNVKQTSTVTETTTSDTTTTVNCAFDPCLIPNFWGDGRRCELDKFCRHICICLEGSTHANCKPTMIQPSLTTSNVKQTSTVTETTTSDTTTTVNCAFDPCLIPNFCGDGRRCELDKFCRHICICLEGSTHANCKPTTIQPSLTTSNVKQTSTVTETTTSDTATTVNCAFDQSLIPNFCGDGSRCELDKFCRHICICLEGSTHADCKPTTIQPSLTTSNVKQTSTVTETTTSDTTTTVNCAFDPCFIPNFCGDGRRCELDKFCRHICICLEGSTHANCKPTTIQPSLTTFNVKQTSTVTETTTSDTTTTVNCAFDPCLIPNFCGDGRRYELDKFCRHICICLEGSTHANCKPTTIQPSLTTSNVKQTSTVTEATTSDTTTTVNCAFDPCLIPNFCGDGRRCELDKFCRHICICLEGSTHANCNPQRFNINIDNDSTNKVKDLCHFDRVSAYFSDASQNFPMHKISLVFF